MWPEQLERLEVPSTETGVAVCNSLGGNIVDFRHVEFQISQTPKWKFFRRGDLHWKYLFQRHQHRNGILKPWTRVDAQGMSLVYRLGPGALSKSRRWKRHITHIETSQWSRRKGKSKWDPTAAKWSKCINKEAMIMNQTPQRQGMRFACRTEQPADH